MIWVAFILGLGGSLHCASMCGPLVFSVQKSFGLTGVGAGVIGYHIGRMVGYLLLGGLISLITVPAVLFGVQQYLSIVSGLMILLWVFRDRISAIRTIVSRFSHALSAKMQAVSHRKSSLPLLGFLNGLLPCGLSYAAAAMSLNYQPFQNSLLFMLAFGVGTLPMFLGASVLGRLLNYKLRFSINKAMKYMMVGAALLLVVRGAGLGIPYLSPAFQPETSHVDCCEISDHKPGP